VKFQEDRDSQISKLDKRMKRLHPTPYLNSIKKKGGEKGEEMFN
jgi:hypothetical protein